MQMKRPVAYKKTPKRLSVDISAETLHSRKEWFDILNVLKDKMGSQ